MAKEAKYPKLAERFRKLREELDTNEKDCTQDMLKKKLYITKTQISELERGRREPSVTELKAYSKYFNVPMEYLLGISNNRHYQNMDVGRELGLSDGAIEAIKTLDELEDTYNKHLIIGGFLKDNEKTQTYKKTNDTDDIFPIMQTFNCLLEFEEGFPFVELIRLITEYVELNKIQIEVPNIKKAYDNKFDIHTPPPEGIYEQMTKEIQQEARKEEHSKKIRLTKMDMRDKFDELIGKVIEKEVQNG